MGTVGGRAERKNTVNAILRYEILKSKLKNVELCFDTQNTRFIFGGTPTGCACLLNHSCVSLCRIKSFSLSEYFGLCSLLFEFSDLFLTVIIQSYPETYPYPGHSLTCLLEALVKMQRLINFS